MRAAASCRADFENRLRLWIFALSEAGIVASAGASQHTAASQHGVSAHFSARATGSAFSRFALDGEKKMRQCDTSRRAPYGSRLV